ncbi:hypothetical protein VZ94_01515 [Methylocucumis oryzae]|uniref:Uncharacterized protein n=1 Tax=Methylocucumis oryzae TaxID=1632867 RepID=A0A0F3IQN8_9GAMM|nr:hypothetical protein VZ94_01515 [Methylocucumis oryzae]
MFVRVANAVGFDELYDYVFVAVSVGSLPNSNRQLLYFKRLSFRFLQLAVGYATRTFLLILLRFF